jgi:hypothetical protein
MMKGGYRMRKIWILLLGLILPFAASAGPGDMALIAVNHPGEDTVGALLAENLMVVRDMETYLLVVTGDEGRRILDDMGLDWTVLDDSVEGKAFFTVGVGKEAPLSLIQTRARLLRFDGREAVVEASQAEASDLAAGGFDIARVFMRPVRQPAVERFVPLKAQVGYDPDIETMVNSVSGAQVDAAVQRLQDFQTRYATTDSCQAAAEWIRDRFEACGIESVYFHNFSTLYKDNVVATIPGKGDPSKIVLIGGHYDSITSNHDFCPGADDNASGAACVLECARVLSNYDFNYTLVFVAFCGEELGLYGSEAYAADAQARGDDIVGAVAVDMIGYLVSGDAMDLDIIDNGTSQWIRDLAVDVGNQYVPELPVVDGSLPGGASSDHASFWAHGYDAILFFEDTDNYSPYIHTANDVVGLSYNSSTMAERCVKVAVGLIASMAEPFRVAITHTPIEDTGDTAGPYRVVADIVSAEALNPDSLLVRYSVGTGGETTLTMNATGNQDEYEAFIPGQPGGTFVSYYVVAEDTQGNRATHPAGAPAQVHIFFVGAITPVVEHDFESDQGWTVGDAGDNATTGIWERCDPQGTVAQPEDDHTPGVGVDAYITQCAAGSGQGSYDVDGGKTTLLSPVFDLSAYPNATVRYYRWYSNDTGSSPETDDWLVDVSDDGGSTWARIDSLRSSDRTWRLVERDLGDYVELTSSVRFRFIASDTDPGSVVEAGVDDFSIVTFEQSDAGVGGMVRGGLFLAPNVPNPFSTGTAITFRVPAPRRRASLRVYDVRGREVVTLFEGPADSSPSTIGWDGTGRDGSEVPAGIYFIRLADGRETVSRKVVLAR